MTKDHGMNEKHSRDSTYFVLLNEPSPRTTVKLVRGGKFFYWGPRMLRMLQTTLCKLHVLRLLREFTRSYLETAVRS